MSNAGRFGRMPYKDYEAEEEVVQEPKKREKKAPGTGDFVQIKLAQHLYGTLKVVAGISGKTAPELLDEIVANALEEYKGMTIEDILKK